LLFLLFPSASNFCFPQSRCTNTCHMNMDQLIAATRHVSSIVGAVLKRKWRRQLYYARAWKETVSEWVSEWVKSGGEIRPPVNVVLAPWFCICCSVSVFRWGQRFSAPFLADRPRDPLNLLCDEYRAFFPGG
jgi:hypothetical protein